MKEIVSTKRSYISDDGEKFDSKVACIAHEKAVAEGGIYIFGYKISEDRFHKEYLVRGYWLTNYSPGKLDILLPSNLGGGLAGKIHGSKADELGKFHDPWNYAVHKRRLEKKLGKI